MSDRKPETVLVKDKYYIDKTKMLEKGIVQFPSIYIEGAAGSGKTSAVRLLLKKHSEVTAEVFWIDEESKNPERFLEKIEKLADRMKNEKIWAVFENVPAGKQWNCEGSVSSLIRHMPEECRVLMTGREHPGSELLRLLWERQMCCVTQDALLFTREEVRRLAEMTGTLQAADAVYEESSGWAGCADLMLRFIKEREENGLEALRPDELCSQYEIEAYIQNEIIGSLSGEEQEMLRRGVLCPWLNESLCEEIWGISQSGQILEKLERKGIFRKDRKKKIWKVAPLFQKSVENSRSYGKQGYSEQFWIELAAWYERRGFIKETFLCLENSDNQKEYRACLIRHYQRVPFMEIPFSEVRNWKENIAELCYLRGVYCYSRQDFLGLEKEIGRLLALRNIQDEKKQREIYLNLLFLNPLCSLEEWLSAVEKLEIEENGERYQLYGMIGSSCTFLCGLRDLAGLFTGSKREVNRKAGLWKRNFGEAEWIGYCLARIDYELETDRKNSLSEADVQLLLEDGPFDEWPVKLAKMYLLCKLQAFHKDEERKIRIDRLKEELLQENVTLCIRNTEAAGSLYTVWYGEMEGLVRWLRSTTNEEIYGKGNRSYLLFFAQAKGFLLLNQYKKAEQKLDRAIECLRTYKWNRFLAEALFQKAILRWTDGERSKAVKYAVESFLVSQKERYVGMYCAYGKKGQEVLMAYVEWMQGNSADGWHRKKKYNYGNIQRMPQADYLDVLLRLTKKNLKNIKNLPTGEAWRDDVIEKLTLTEISVLQNIGKGMNNEEICQEMNMKLSTVKSHLYSLYKKMGVNSRMQAVIKGKEIGILR